MTAPVTREQLMAVVEGSPKAVGAHDRSTWVALFAGDGQVNDPVGSRPHNGQAAIESFYDTFIAPNSITFHVERDIVCGRTVWRDL
ncbi:nuclear transport factor 2 family protein, partial [Enterococcus faecium]